MSRWLRNVNALLETLDNQVEETVEEHRYNRSIVVAAVGAAVAVADSSEGTSSAAAEDWRRQQLEAQDVANILAKRGLLDDDVVEEDNSGEDYENVVEFSGASDEATSENAITVIDVDDRSGVDNASPDKIVDEGFARPLIENKPTSNQEYGLIYEKKISG